MTDAIVIMHRNGMNPCQMEVSRISLYSRKVTKLSQTSVQTIPNIAPRGRNATSQILEKVFHSHDASPLLHPSC